MQHDYQTGDNIIDLVYMGKAQAYGGPFERLNFLPFALTPWGNPVFYAAQPAGVDAEFIREARNIAERTPKTKVRQQGPPINL